MIVSGEVLCSRLLSRLTAGSRKALQVLAAIRRVLKRAIVDVIAVEEILGLQTWGAQHEFPQAFTSQLETSGNVKVLEVTEQVPVGQE